MTTGRGGMGSHKHGISGYAPRSPRYKFTQTLEANKALAARKRRPALTATTIKEALRNIKRGAAMKFASIIAALDAVLATPAGGTAARAPAHYLDRERVLDLLQPPNVACPDQQTTDEMTAMRRLGDREGEFITGRSYGCGPVIRPRPGPFEG